MRVNTKRTISLLLVLVIMLSLCPMTVWAAGTEPGTDAPESTAAPEVQPTAEPEPTEAPDAAQTPEPTQSPESAGSPEPTAEPEPTQTPDAAEQEPASPVSADALSALAEGLEEPVFLPWDDGDSTPVYTVNFYDPTGTELIATEQVPSGYTPSALVGPYHNEKLIVCWTSENHDWAGQGDEIWADEDFQQDVLLPMYVPIEADTNFYAVYALEEAGLANVPFYLSNSYMSGEGGFSLVDWLALDLNESTRLSSSEVPAYMAFLVTDGNGEAQPLYMSFSWYTDKNLSGSPVDPAEVTLSGNTVFYGEIPSSFWFVYFEDADGKALETYAIEDGGTIADYPGNDKTLPEGDFWQDQNGEVYSADEIKNLPMGGKDLILTPFEGYTVNYYECENGSKIGTETVLPGGTPQNIPVHEHESSITEYHNGTDNSYPYVWFATDAEADSFDTEGFSGTPLDLSQQVINADTDFYGARDFCFVYQYQLDGTRCNALFAYAGQKIDVLPPVDGANLYTGYWKDENGDPIDLETFVLDGEDFDMYPRDGIVVSYYYGDELFFAELVPEGNTPVIPPDKYVYSTIVTSPSVNIEIHELPITGWVDEDGKEVDPATVTITEETCFYAADAQSEGFTVTYLDADGETVLGTETVAEGGSPEKAPAKNGSSKTVTNWLNAAGSFVNLATLTVSEDISLTAWYSPGLNSSDHTQYINGFGNAEFGPQENLTRAQAAKIIYSLLADSSTGPYSASYTDVKSTAWYNEPVSALASHKILTGYSDGEGGFYFNPNDSITRAEFVTILSRLFPMESGSCNFTDVKTTSWYYSAVATAVEKGWVNGYDNGDGSYSFRPNSGITRAEAVTIVNRVLGREADMAAINETERLIYVDVSPSHWAFGNIMEASVSHEHSSGANGEVWTDFTLPVCGLKDGLRNRGGKLYYVDETDHCLMRFQPGLNQLPDGKTYYVDKDGCAISQYAAGIQELGGKLYYVQNDYSVRTQRYMTGYETPVYEYNGKMYYVKEDYSLARNESVGYLYFGTDGAYTTGDPELDSVCYSFISDIIRDTSKTQRQKLETAYHYIIDKQATASQETALRKTYFFYASAGSVSDFSMNECALRMFKKTKGDCYHWAAMMVTIMRRLGYDAYREHGKIWNNTRVHAWEIINMPDGTRKLFDVEMEWGYRWGYYNMGSDGVPRRLDYDCYMKSPNISSTSSPRLPWAPYRAY